MREISSFLPYFFSLSSFAKHSTIRTPGTGYLRAGARVQSTWPSSEQLRLSQFQVYPSPPGHLLGICHLVCPGGGDLSENHFPGLGHWSFLLEAVNVVSFSIFHQKIYTHLETFNAPINGSGGCPGGMVTGQIEVRINKTFNLSGGGGEGLGTCDLKKAP